MRSEKECLIMAERMEAFALSCPINFAVEYSRMADQWRSLARDTAWQDGSSTVL
jgi:hypothetical protein